MIKSIIPSYLVEGSFTDENINNAHIDLEAKSIEFNDGSRLWLSVLIELNIISWVSH